MHNHKVLNDKPDETRINNCNYHNNDICPLPNSCQIKCIVYQANTDCDITRSRQKCYLGSCETTFIDNFDNHKKLFNQVKHKNDTGLPKEFWGKNSTMEHQKLHGKLSEYVVLTIPIVSAAFYV